jgi:hypothetical protein
MESEETLRKDEATNKILEAIIEMRQDVNAQIIEMRREMNTQINELRQEMLLRFEKVESELQTMKQLQLSFDVRLDRLEAMNLNIRADVKILRAEVEAWAADVVLLRKNYEMNLKS